MSSPINNPVSITENLFIVEVWENDFAVKPLCHFLAEPQPYLFEVARRMSAQYPNGHVSLTMYARVRARFMKGKCVKQHPDLSYFYTNVTPLMQHAWGCYQVLPSGVSPNSLTYQLLDCGGKEDGSDID